MAEAWAVAFDRALGHAAAKQVVPWASASFSRDALAIRVAEVEIGPMRTRGALAAEDARIEWDLAFAGGVGAVRAAARAALPRRRGQREDREPASRPALRRPLPRRRSARGCVRLARDAGSQLGPPPHPPLRLAALQRLGGRRRPGRGRDQRAREARAGGRAADHAGDRRARGRAPSLHAAGKPVARARADRRARVGVQRSERERAHPRDVRRGDRGLRRPPLRESRSAR